MISEYEIGRYGWIMQLRTIAGRIGLALLLVSAVGLSIGAILRPPERS